MRISDWSSDVCSSDLRLTRQAAGEEARIILDPRTTSCCCNHFQIEVRPLFEPLVLEQFALRLKLFQALGKLVTDALHRLFERRPRRDRKSPRLNSSH